MKYIVLMLLVVVLSPNLVSVFAALGLPENLKCPVCVQRGYKTVVNEGASTCTSLAAMPYYDENGKYHYNNPNIVTTAYSCASGHTFSVAASTETHSITVINSNDNVIAFFPWSNVTLSNYVSSVFANTNYMNYYVTNSSMCNIWSSSVSIHGVEFKLDNDVLVVDTHDKSMNEAGSNLIEFVVSEFKRSGYKLIKE
jgi:hypothetical protein